MTRFEIINKVWLSSSHVMLDIEEIVGEFDNLQKAQVLGILMGFWAANEDILHPLRRSRWVDVIKENMMKKPER